MDDKNNVFSEKVSFLLIDLTKFAAQTDFEKLPGLREKWCYVIKNMWRTTDSDIPVSDTSFRELYEECKLSKLSDMEKQEYEKSILEYDDVKDAIEYNRRLGRAEGREEGREEALRQAAKKFIEMGISIEDVTKATELDVEILQEL